MSDPRVEQLLSELANSGRRVRLFYGEPSTGSDWMEENDVSGFVGRSMGPQKIYILLPTKRSSGGGGILVDRIVRMIVDGREVYRHPNYKPPQFEFRGGDNVDLPYEVHVSGKVHARFKSDLARKRWVAFMQGERMAKENPLSETTKRALWIGGLIGGAGLLVGGIALASSGTKTTAPSPGGPPPGGPTPPTGGIPPAPPPRIKATAKDVDGTVTLHVGDVLDYLPYNGAAWDVAPTSSAAAILATNPDGSLSALAPGSVSVTGKFTDGTITRQTQLTVNVVAVSYVNAPTPALTPVVLTPVQLAPPM